MEWKKKIVKQSDYKRLTVFKSLNKTQKEINKRVSCKALVNIQQSGISGRKHLHESIIKLHCRADSQKKKTKKQNLASVDSYTASALIYCKYISQSNSVHRTKHTSEPVKKKKVPRSTFSLSSLQKLFQVESLVCCACSSSAELSHANRKVTPALIPNKLECCGKHKENRTPANNAFRRRLTPLKTCHDNSSK